MATHFSRTVGPHSPISSFSFGTELNLCELSFDPMPVDQARTRLHFEKLSRQLSKLRKKAAADNVHRFRTYSRRVETLLSELVPQPARNEKKLVKLLGKLRKKAGRVRDLDVQTGALRSLKIPQEPARKSQLLRALAEDRARREKKLLKTFNGDTVQELRRRLKRATKRVQIPAIADPLALAVQKIAQLNLEHPSLSDDVLHQYRIVGKRARYLAELATKTPDSEKFLERVTRMQDVLGDWHDWLQLTQRAEKLFKNVDRSPLIAALRNVSRAKFRHGVAVLSETRTALTEKKVTHVAPPKKPSPQESLGQAAVA
jgi:CHAD domain-containing protein